MPMSSPRSTKSRSKPSMWLIPMHAAFSLVSAPLCIYMHLMQVEFTYDQYDVMFINTTRVDAFQYPMGVELFGTSQSNNAYMKRGELLSYNDIISRWNQQNGNSPFSACYQENVTTDNLGGIIIQPSKVAAVKNNGYFDNYINQIWSYFATHELYADMGQRGKWRGTVQGNTFVLTNGGQTAYVNKPSTTDVIEGAGTFATGSDIDKVMSTPPTDNCRTGVTEPVSSPATRGIPMWHSSIRTT